MNTPQDQVLKQIDDTLAENAGGEAVLAALDRVLERFACVVGTVHRLSAETGRLEIVVDRGIPDAIRDRVSDIPIGKGMAGLAAERLEPVQVCNLQTDESGQAKPAAKLTEMAGSISFPMLVNGQLRGTMGIAKPEAYEFDDAEQDLLMKIGARFGRHLETHDGQR